MDTIRFEDSFQALFDCAVFWGSYLLRNFPGADSTDFYIFLGLAAIPVTFTLMGLAYMSWQHCHRMGKYCTCTCCKDLEKRDVNDIYGTYARGWDGEGEYGDGDKVYVSHSNSEYQSYDYMETELDTRIRDQNSTYGSN